MGGSHQRRALEWLCAALAVVATAGGVVEDDASSVPLDSPAGQALLRGCSHPGAFWGLAMHFATQLPGNCGPTTAVIVLNALGVPRPVSEEYSSPAFNITNRYWEQHNVMASPCAKNVTSPWRGALEQVAGLAGCGGADVEAVRAASSTPAAFREQLIDVFSGERPGAVAVNFARRFVGQAPAIGHHSPVGAYDAKSDMVLVMDVARYKYPPVWHPLPRLFEAMARADDQPVEPFRNFTTPRGWWVARAPSNAVSAEAALTSSWRSSRGSAAETAAAWLHRGPASHGSVLMVLMALLVVLV